MARRRLIWLCPEWAPYHETLFRAISMSGEFDLHVEFMFTQLGPYPWERDFSKTYTHRVADAKKWVDRDVVKRVLAEKDAAVVVSSYVCPTLIAAMRALARRNRRFCFWSDVPLPQSLQWNWNEEFPRRRSPLRAWARRRLLSWIYSRAHRVLVMGTPGITAAVHLGCPPEKTIVFPCWVPVNGTPTPRNLVEGHRNLVGLARLVYLKGYDVAIGAFARAVEQGAIPQDVNLVLAGNGKVEADLKKQAARHGVEGRVQFPGWLDEVGKRELFSKAAALIHPARWEAFCVVVLEAMERGIPVLGSNNTMAVLDRVEHGVSGYVHPVNDYDELSGQIVNLYKDPGKYFKLSQSARATAEVWRPQRAVEILKRIWTAENDEYAA